MTGEGDAEHARAEETEADHGHQRGAAKAVQLGAGGHHGPQQRNRHLVVEHGQVAPAGDEKGARDRHRSPTVPSNPPR